MIIRKRISNASHRRLRSGSWGLLLVTLVVSGCGWTGLATLNSNDEQANNDSFLAAVSDSAQHVAYQSLGSNLVPGDSNGEQDVFVRDMAAGTTSRASVSSTGIQANDGSYNAAISGNGRYVAFTSDASNLVFSDSNGFRDVFLHDTDTGFTQRLSALGVIIITQGNEDSDNVDLSCTAGCIAAFESSASNLVSNDFNNTQDIFRWVSGGIHRLSVDKNGNDADGGSANPSLSSGGGIMAFDSSATNLLDFGTDTNGLQDVYVRNTALEQNSLGSVNWIGGFANGNSSNPDVSADGRYVVFESQASDLLFGDINTGTAIYLRDRFNFSNEKISVNTAGESANGVSLSPAISADGRYVTFWSNASNLVLDDSNNARDIFVRDRWKNTTTRLSVDTFGEQANGLNDHPAISGDGRYGVFSSAADNLVPNDNNVIHIGGGFFRSAFDIVVRVVADVTVTGMVPSELTAGTTTAVTVSGTNFLSGAVAELSDNDETVSNLVIVDENTISMDITISSGAAPGARQVNVLLPGTGPGIDRGNVGTCIGCASIVAAQ